MTALPTHTPQETNQIEHFIVRFKDGRVKKVMVGQGEGYYKEGFYKGPSKSFRTFECYIAEGDPQDIPGGKK